MTGPLMHHDSGMAGSGAGMATKKRPLASAPARLRRMYIDCRYGQLHLATAYPASGGFDEAAPVVFVHAEDGTGADFNRCAALLDRKSTRLNSSHSQISYAVFCLKKK